MITRGKKLKKETERMKLGPEGIDRAAGFMEETLSLAGVERKDILRLRLAAEDLLMMWNSRLPEDTELVFRCGTRLGKPYLHLCARGSRIDPAQTEEESGWIYSELLARAGLSLEASYRDGENRLSVYPPKANRFGALSQIFLAIALAVLAGAVCRTLPQGVRSGISSFVDPLFTAMMGILQTLAGPMVFLSVCRGIINIGDVGMLGKIGRTIVLRFLAAVYIITAVTALAVTWFFHPGSGTETKGANAVFGIYSMLLEIFPQNVVSPFLEGNSLQLIFMGACIGLVLLVLADRASFVTEFTKQANYVVQYMMEIFGRCIPLFVFISLFSLIITDVLDGIGGIVKGVLLCIAACVIWPLLYALAVSIKLRVPCPMLLRKLLPTYLIGLTTASSSAALSTNLETCEKRLGISQKVTSFGVPLGQVVFKTGGAIGFLLMALGLAENYDVAVTLPWAVTAVLITGILAVAAAPVPGGYLPCYTVLMTQLGIPEEAIALAIAGNVILDFFMTSCGLACLQSELVLVSNRLGLLDTEILKN